MHEPQGPDWMRTRWFKWLVWTCVAVLLAYLFIPPSLRIILLLVG